MIARKKTSRCVMILSEENDVFYVTKIYKEFAIVSPMYAHNKTEAMEIFDEMK